MYKGGSCSYAISTKIYCTGTYIFTEKKKSFDHVGGFDPITGGLVPILPNI